MPDMPTLPARPQPHLLRNGLAAQRRKAEAAAGAQVGGAVKGLKQVGCQAIVPAAHTRQREEGSSGTAWSAGQPQLPQLAGERSSANSSAAAQAARQCT